MKTLKSLMIDVPPINAMPYKKYLNRIEMAAKIGKQLPHPTIQTAAHVADLAVKAVKQVNKETAKSRIRKKTVKAPKPE